MNYISIVTPQKFNEIISSAAHNSPVSVTLGDVTPSLEYPCVEIVTQSFDEFNRLVDLAGNPKPQSSRLTSLDVLYLYAHSDAPEYVTLDCAAYAAVYSPMKSLSNESEA